MPYIAAQEQFLIYTNQTHMFRYEFDHNRTEQIPITGRASVLTVEYDYANDCVFWSDSRLYSIQVGSLLQLVEVFSILL